MKKSLSVAIATVLLAGSVPALAQSEPTEQVTVFAPYIVKKVRTGRPRDPVTTVTITKVVNYQDLDLTTATGETTLGSRVRQAAQDMCRELDRRFPPKVYVIVSEDKDCAKNAEANAMTQVHGVVAAARAN